MRKKALGSVLLIGVLAGPACNDSESGAPTAPAPTGLLTFHLDVRVATDDDVNKFSSWTLLMDGAVLRSESCSYGRYGCSSISFLASPLVLSGSHTIELRFDEGRDIQGGRFRPGVRVLCRITVNYRTRSHDTGQLVEFVRLPDREVSLAEGESTTYALVLH